MGFCLHQLDRRGGARGTAQVRGPSGWRSSTSTSTSRAMAPGGHLQGRPDGVLRLQPPDAVSTPAPARRASPASAISATPRYRPGAAWRGNAGGLYRPDPAGAGSVSAGLPLGLGRILVPTIAIRSPGSTGTPEDFAWVTGAAGGCRGAGVRGTAGVDARRAATTGTASPPGPPRMLKC